MTVDELCEWLATSRDSQRAKFEAIRTHHVERIGALADADHKRVIREIKKRLNSPKLADAVAALVAELAREYAPEPPKPVPIVDTAPSNPAMERGDELAAAIAADPENRENYLPYGDWLEGIGDPRGALIAIGAALAKDPQHAAMLRAHREHLIAHPKVAGVVATHGDVVTNVEWFMGFVRRCRVAYTMTRFNRELPAVALDELLAELLAGPGRFLQNLTLGVVRHDGNRYDPVVAALARAPRPALRKLFIGDFSRDECELNWASIGGLAALWPAVPNLRDLTLRAGSIQIGPISLPKLERLETITGGLDTESVRQIANADWPELRTLSLCIGRRGEGAASDVTLLAPLLEGTRAPKLQSLGILNCEFTEELVDHLVDAPIVERLVELDLGMGTLGDDGARVLAKAKRLHHLRLSVDDNYLTAAGLETLRAVFAQVSESEQRDDGGDPTDRFASFFE